MFASHTTQKSGCFPHSISMLALNTSQMFNNSEICNVTL